MLATPRTTAIPWPTGPLTVSSAAPFFIVMNGASGHQDKNDVQSVVRDVMARAGRRHTVEVVTQPGQLAATAARVVREARAAEGVVVAAGGDGTINTVAQAALGSGRPFGVLPQGTFNYFSRTHGIPSDTQAAAELLTRARAYPVQVGRINERVFLVNASLGLYPQLLEDREAFKQQYGRSRLVAVASSLATLMRHHRLLRLRIERGNGVHDLRTPTLFVGNNRLQLEQTGFAESRATERGLLAAVAIKPVGTVAMLWLMLRGAVGRLGEADNVESFAFRRITVTPVGLLGGRRIKVATDGEIAWMTGPLEFGVASEPLMLLRPDEPVADGERQEATT